MGGRVVVIGFDGADRDVIASLADAGRLPALAEMRAHGVWARVDAWPGLGDDAAWSSFATGVGPGRHGRRYHRAYRRGTYAFVESTRDAILEPPFWDACAAASRCVAVIDVPKAPIGRDDRNVVVSDWLSHGAHHVQPRCDPVGGVHDVGVDIDVAESSWDCDTAVIDDGFVERLRRRATLRGDAVVGLLREPRWDAVIAVFAETHCGGHRLWGDHASVERVYRAVDDQLARIMRAAGPSTTVVAFSPLGMTRSSSASALADAVLARLDDESVRSPWSRRARAIDALRDLVPRRVRRRTPGPVRSAVDRTRVRASADRRFWQVPTDLSHTAIRVNVIGREPHGTVAPQALRAVCDELEYAFRALRDPSDGRPLVRDVIVDRDAYPGHAPDDFADVYVVWDATRPLRGACSPRIGEVRVEPRDSRPGEHRDGGWFVAAGPGITPGALDDAMSVADLAPTVARLLGVTLAADGRAVDFVTAAAR